MAAETKKTRKNIKKSDLPIDRRTDQQTDYYTPLKIVLRGGGRGMMISVFDREENILEKMLVTICLAFENRVNYLFCGNQHCLPINKMFQRLLLSRSLKTGTVK